MWALALLGRGTRLGYPGYYENLLFYVRVILGNFERLRQRSARLNQCAKNAAIEWSSRKMGKSCSNPNCSSIKMLSGI